MNTDPIADFLTRIRNGISAKHRIVEIPSSNIKKEITRVLHEKGFIINYSNNLSIYHHNIISNNNGSE